MAKKKEYKIIITVTKDELKREIIGSNVTKAEVVGVLELVKTTIINNVIVKD